MRKICARLFINIFILINFIFLFSACGSRQEADIMFILDSINAGKKNTRRAIDFIKALVDDLDIHAHKIQVGLMSAECEDEQTGFTLDRNNDRVQVVKSLSNIRATDLSQVLKQMRRGAFSPDNGARKEARRIAILIIDGNLESPINALTEAQRARMHGIEVFVIQVGHFNLFSKASDSVYCYCIVLNMVQKTFHKDYLPVVKSFPMHQILMLYVASAIVIKQVLLERL